MFHNSKFEKMFVFGDYSTAKARSGHGVGKNGKEKARLVERDRIGRRS
jgi:hypothetical protein